MVEISLSGSGEGPGWVTAPGYSTAAFSAPRPMMREAVKSLRGPVAGPGWSALLHPRQDHHHPLGRGRRLGAHTGFQALSQSLT